MGEHVVVMESGIIVGCCFLDGEWVFDVGVGWLFGVEFDGEWVVISIVEGFEISLCGWFVFVDVGGVCWSYEL